MTRAAPPVADRLAATLGRLLGPDFPPEIGLAVSGGGDSMAMLHLVTAWARPMGIGLRVVTIDHGLRPEAAAEAALVADEARGLGLSHDVLRWDGWDGQRNLMDAARRARLDLIGGWRGNLRHVLFAHTRDDVAETFLMRLGRGSGVEGLAALAESRRVADPVGPTGWTLLRPLLDVSRAELRHVLKVLRIPFAEDPTNDDAAFLRTRARQALDALAPMGITRDGIATTAARLAADRSVVTGRAAEVARRLVDQQRYLAIDHPDRFARVSPFAYGDVWIRTRSDWTFVERVTRLRLMSAALQYVASNPYRPRAEAVSDLLDRVEGGAKATLHGCMVVPMRDTIFVFREPAAVVNEVSKAGGGTLWDRRWQLSGRDVNGLEVRALGWQPEAAVEASRNYSYPDGLMASRPALWDGDRLVVCDPTGSGPNYRMRLRSPLAPETGGLPELLLSR